MRTILTKEEVKNLVEEKDGILISDEIINHVRILKIKCNKDGNEWEIPLSRFRQGDWCKVCYLKKTEVNTENVIELVKSKGYELLSTGQFNRETKIEVKCQKHNLVWVTSYHNLKYTNGRCKLCACDFPSIEEIKSFVEKKDGVFLERIKTDNKSKRNLLVKCNKHNTTFTTRWQDLQRGIWCKKCFTDSRKIKYEDIKKLVESKNGTLLDINCSSAIKPFMVRCNKDNFEWSISWSNIKQGCWCPRCSGCEKYTVEKVREIVSKKGGELLTDYIKNVKQNIKIKCSCGNVFDANLGHVISHGLWCQLCSLAHCEQRNVYDVIKQIFPNYEIKYNFRGFSWLKTKKSNPAMEIDIWIPEIKLAIEYDGKQHFEPVRFASSMTEETALKVLKGIQHRDKKKNKLIANHTEEIKHFIRFSYKDSIDKNSILKALENSNVNIPKIGA